nr:hypothetical protein [Tanacetum cinerariifolium]
MHKEAHQAVGGPTSLGATSKYGAHPQLSSGTNPSVLVDQTKSSRNGLKSAQTNSGTNKESEANEISKKIKLEDLSDLLKYKISSFFTPDSPQDEPIIVLDKTEFQALPVLVSLVQKQFKTLDSLPSQAIASPAESTTKDAETNLQNELVDLLGIDVVEQYHNKKLLFDNYYYKMLKRKKAQRS